jgi:hypothetical protein
LLGALVTLILSLLAQNLGQVAAQLIILAAGVILAGVGVMQRLQDNGTVAGTILTAGVLTRLLYILGAILLLMVASVFLVSPDESRIALTAFAPAPPEPLRPLPNLAAGPVIDVHSTTFTWGAPGGGLPDGTPRPFPWLFYTQAVCFFLGLVFVTSVGSGLLLKWGIYNQFVAEEPGPAEVQTSSALILVLAAIVAFLAYLGLAWDSGRMFLCVASLVAIVGAMIIVLPIVWRKVIASILIVVHFGGICTAITAIDAPNAPAPWLPSKMWLVFYRPYLQFTYMNNAYHFYSPEPGPASLLWARLEYEGGGVKEVVYPSRANSPAPLYYQRMLSISESMGQTMGPPDDIQARLGARRSRGDKDNIWMHPSLPEMFQYRHPNPTAMLLTSAYARHLARMFPTLDGKNIKRIKIYRETHNIVNVALFANGQSAGDELLYLPYYFGTFTPDGTLTDPKSPYLYWLIPILPDRTRPGQVINCRNIHAANFAGEPEVP